MCIYFQGDSLISHACPAQRERSAVSLLFEGARVQVGVEELLVCSVSVWLFVVKEADALWGGGDRVLGHQEANFSLTVSHHPR